MIAQRHDIDITDRSQTVSGHKFLKRLRGLGGAAMEGAGKAQGQVATGRTGEEMRVAGQMVLIDRGKECCRAAAPLGEKIFFRNDPADCPFLEVTFGKDF